MSSHSFTADLMLNGIQYQGLDNYPEYVDEWFRAWEQALLRKNFRDLLTLTHWGLQLPFHQEKDQDSVTRLFCHYLAVADGHQSAKNFGYHGSVNSETDFSRMSPGERLQKLSDKAWTELCNRVFVFSNDGYGEHLKYAWHFRQPSLATAFISFIDPDRWCGRSFYHYELANIDVLNNAAYHVKALAFTRMFLEEAWQYREIMERENEFRDLSKEDTAKLDYNIQFFRQLKPKLAKLMINYNMVDFLHDRKLDHPTRRVLCNFALSGNTRLHTPAPDCEKMDLAKAYGQLNPEHGYWSMSYRESARILLLYPSIVQGRREYVRAQVRKKLAAKAAEAERLRAELATVAAKLGAL